jgi:hypothetical protein
LFVGQQPAWLPESRQWSGAPMRCCGDEVV